nr:DUF5677 domain-containing protein [Ureibacillus chungkukjangi]
MNKQIIDQQAIAVVPSRKIANLPISDLDVEEDYIFFCFTKFTKTMLAIQKLIELELFEDALILTRSNYECFIHAKSVVKYNNMIDHLVEYKLGLINEKRYKYVENKKGRIVRNKIVDIANSKEFDFINQIKSIAIKANEKITYEYIYPYLCDITHCNLITSAYYRDGIKYSYDKVNEQAKFNVLLWNVYFNLKFYNTLIEAEIFEIDELEERVLDVLISDSLKLLKVFEQEEKKAIKQLDELTGSTERDSFMNYINVIKELKSNLS